MQIDFSYMLPWCTKPLHVCVLQQDRSSSPTMLSIYLVIIEVLSHLHTWLQLSGDLVLVITDVACDCDGDIGAEEGV